jgi:hypothetical protein
MLGAAHTRFIGGYVMSTLIENGYTITQHKDYIVSVSKNGKDIVRFAFKRELSGNELSELAFWVRCR